MRPSIPSTISDNCVPADDPRNRVMENSRNRLEGLNWYWNHSKLLAVSRTIEKVDTPLPALGIEYYSRRSKQTVSFDPLVHDSTDHWSKKGRFSYGTIFSAAPIFIRQKKPYPLFFHNIPGFDNEWYNTSTSTIYLTANGGTIDKIKNPLNFNLFSIADGAYRKETARTRKANFASRGSEGRGAEAGSTTKTRIPKKKTLMEPVRKTAPREEEKEETRAVSE